MLSGMELPLLNILSKKPMNITMTPPRLPTGLLAATIAAFFLSMAPAQAQPAPCAPLEN